jgi:integrase/recombinase XerD
MMHIDSGFKAARSFTYSRASTAGDHLGSFAAALVSAGYVPSAVQRRVKAAAHLGCWADDNRLLLGSLGEQALLAFGRHLLRCRCIKRRRRGVGADQLDARLATLFLAHLRTLGVVAPAPVPAPSVSHPLLVSFQAWMLRHRGVTPSTMKVYLRPLVELLAILGGNPDAYTPTAIRRFFVDAHGRGRGWMRTATTATRSFLRYLVVEGRCASGLDAVVPAVVQWRLATLPRALAPAAVDRLLATCDSTTRCGLRDRAVLLLLVRLGLRAGDVAELRLTDIDWGAGTLHVRGKGRRESILPLPQDVGDALLAYLERGRPAHHDTRIFLRAIAPHQPFATAEAVSSIVRTALQHAEITDAPSHGAHQLRHAAATAMLRAGVSLDGIAGVLRHRSPATTALYAKVDVALLASIAQPWWPEVRS